MKNLILYFKKNKKTHPFTIRSVTIFSSLVYSKTRIEQDCPLVGIDWYSCWTPRCGM